MGEKTFIEVDFNFYSYHKYTDAPDVVKFLRESHPHYFICSVKIEVKHADRELEFFIVKEDLVNFVDKVYHLKQFEKSCEQIAREILKHCKTRYPDRSITVTVGEDGIQRVSVEYVCTWS